ncbi:MAG: HAD-IA family hydrolase [Lentisphaerae bacterium]|jgi:HAD superfamily hydrolase (TIGR01509 family)|nr:HAD-IA family hydrolase [Lentisphaerota bacterium]
MINAVIFDMDGVLCDSEPFICEASVDMFRMRHGVTVQPTDFHPFTGMGEDRFLSGVAELYNVAINIKSDKKFTYDRYLEIIKGRLTPLHGTADFIAACRARNLRLAVASSADRIKVEGNLKQIGIPLSHFHAVIDGTMVELKKPAPDIFLLAARQLGVLPAECVVFEDAVSGIEAARAAGMYAVGVRSSLNHATLSQAGAHSTVQDLSEALAAIATLETNNKLNTTNRIEG